MWIIADGPFIILLQENGADEPCDGGLARKDADDLGTALDLVVQALDAQGDQTVPGLYDATER